MTSSMTAQPCSRRCNTADTTSRSSLMSGSAWFKGGPIACSVAMELQTQRFVMTKSSHVNLYRGSLTNSLTPDTLEISKDDTALTGASTEGFSGGICVRYGQGRSE